MEEIMQCVYVKSNSKVADAFLWTFLALLSNEYMNNFFELIWVRIMMKDTGEFLSYQIIMLWVALSSIIRRMHFTEYASSYLFYISW